MPISTKETGETYYVSTLGDSDELPDDLDENERKATEGALRAWCKDNNIPLES
jgi:hypothetical protein